MSTLNFQNLRSGFDGQRGSFEELICQLAAISPPSGGGEFRRIEGAGGDGGIECYWQKPDGSKIGYQAKCYLAARDIDWKAIDKSFQTAVATYLDLTVFVVAIACNLSGLVNKRKGTAGTTHWENLRDRWTTQMAAAGRSITFELWDATQIGLRLARPEADGLISFWFDEAFLSERWFESRFKDAVLRLDERFHPEDHVDVAAAFSVGGVRRSPEWLGRLRSLYRETIDSGSNAVIRSLPASRATSDLHLRLKALHLLESDLDVQAAVPFPTAKWVMAAQELASSAYRAERLLQRAATMMASGKQFANRSYLPFHAERQHLSLLKSAADLLEEHLAEPASAAADARQLLILGRAGTGKSHLLASEVQKALQEQAPAVLLLGTDFAQAADPGGQITAILDQRMMSFDAFLNAIHAAALRAGKRALIAIDALNEGIGGHLWRRNLAALLEAIQSRPALAIAVSVRTEFVDMVVPSATKTTISILEVQGFTEVEELEAAAEVYMDRRGLIRPAMPWLSPEFTNPLFLRTTCLALQRAGKTEFPRGLLGTKQLLAFYLDTAATNLGSDYDGSSNLSLPLRQAVAGIAGEMATKRQDFLTRSDAALIIDKAFAAYSAPPGRTWTDLLHRSGILRIDPPIYECDPFAPAEPLYRFGFQRFQDHLIAEALLRGGVNASLFAPTGTLGFMVGQWGIEFEWLGVFQALAIQIADSHQIEIVDLLPGGQARWWSEREVQDAFTESVRWRQPKSFSSRSEALLDQLDYGPAQTISLLLEVSIVKVHAWNADYLHGRLAALPMPQRDAFWTEAINTNAREGSYPANRLLDWIATSGGRHADEEALRLTLTVLGWLFTSTDGRLRDRATKAAADILVLMPALAEDWVSRFSTIDDVYVVERVLAALAAACLRDPKRKRLSMIVPALERDLLRTGLLPTHLLARDYAQLIFELAAKENLLAKGATSANWSAPFGSKPPQLRLHAQRVEAQAKAVGDRRIYSSCCGFAGDFGKYVIESRTRSVSRVPLSSPQPMTYAEAAQDFRKVAIEGDEERESLFDLVCDFPDATETAAPTITSSLELLGRHLRSLIDPAHVRAFDEVILPYINGADGLIGFKSSSLPRHDVSQLRLWVAKRALDLGWTEQLFPRDGSSGDDRTRAERTERIGKKYQWIAYYELLARLADNYWLAQNWNEGRARRYKNSCDLDFTRNIDPTAPGGSNTIGTADLALMPRLDLIPTSVADMPAWVDEDIASGQLRQVANIDKEGDGWVALYRADDCNTRWPTDDRMSSAPFRQQEFTYIFLLSCEPQHRTEIMKAAQRARFDFHDLLDRDHTDGPYLYELGLRETWPKDSWAKIYPSASTQYPVRYPWHGYLWEHHLDGTMAEGLNVVLPAPWLLHELCLSADPASPGQYRDEQGKTVIRCFRDARQCWCLIRKDRLEEALAAKNLAALWVGFGERSAWTEPSDHMCLRQRWNGLLAPTASKSVVRTWRDKN